VAAAKVLNDFAKTNDKLVLKAGSYAGKVLDKAGVQALASIPSREELLAKLLGVMQAPVSGFAVVRWLRWPRNAKKKPLRLSGRFLNRTKLDLGVF
jgi:ribosomal protein L10